MPPITSTIIIEKINFFIKNKLESGSNIEKEYYKKFIINDEILYQKMIARLILKRPIVYLENGKFYQLRDLSTGSGDWSTIGTSQEKEPLILKDYLSLDEIELSSYISFSFNILNDNILVGLSFNFSNFEYCVDLFFKNAIKKSKEINKVAICFIKPINDKEKISKQEQYDTYLKLLDPSLEIYFSCFGKIKYNHGPNCQVGTLDLSSFINASHPDLNKLIISMFAMKPNNYATNDIWPSTESKYIKCKFEDFDRIEILN